MRPYHLFELFLVLFALYALSTFDGGMRTLVPVLCLFTVLMFEALRGDPKINVH